VSEPPRRRALVRLLAWLWPSLVASALAVLIAGAAEALRSGGGVLAIVISIGLAAALAGPIALVLSVGLRGLWRGWRTAELGAALREPSGASPRLWAWMAYGALALIVVALGLVVAVREVARRTAFKPLGVSLLLPVYVIPTVLVLIALSRPCVDGLAALVRRLDRLVARRRGRPIATARAALIVAVVLGVVGPLLAWRTMVRPRLGFIDTRIGLYPAIAAVLLPLGHLALRTRARRALAVVGLGAVAACLAVALWARQSRPILILDLWTRPTIASEAIDRLIDLEAMRTELSTTAFRPVARPGAAHPDILIVTFDTVRADRTPLLGGPASMPHLAGLGARGAIFEWAMSPGNVTRRSLPTIATGASPSRIRGKVNGWALRLDPRHVAMFERFRAAGYDTAGFFCCEGFFEPSRHLGLTRGIDHVVLDRDGRALAIAARTWLDARHAAGTTAPVIVWLHFIESHNWYDESRELVGADDRKRYDFVLTKVDGFLGEVLTSFEGRTPIVVVTADHGEGLGDHGAPYHSSDLYNSQTRVPLVIAGPGIAALRLREPVGLVDVVPTLLDLAGYQPPGLPQVDGRSLADLVTGRRADNPDGGFAYSEMVLDRYVSHRARALVRGRWKLIEHDGLDELYDLRADPTERTNLATLATPLPELAIMRAAMAERARLDRIPAFFTTP